MQGDTCCHKDLQNFGHEQKLIFDIGIGKLLNIEELLNIICA